MAGSRGRQPPGTDGGGYRGHPARGFPLPAASPEISPGISPEISPGTTAQLITPADRKALTRRLLRRALHLMDGGNPGGAGIALREALTHVDTISAVAKAAAVAKAERATPPRRTFPPMPPGPTFSGPTFSGYDIMRATGAVSDPVRLRHHPRPRSKFPVVLVALVALEAVVGAAVVVWALR